MKRILPRLAWAFFGLLVVVLVGLIVAREFFTSYLRSDAFRRSLGEAAAHALHANRADFSPLQFDGALVYGDEFSAARDDGGGFSTINANQLRASFDWHGLLHHAVQIDEMNVQQLDVEPPASGPAAAGAGTESAPVFPAPLSAGRNGLTLDLRKVSIDETNWQWSAEPAGGVNRVALTLTPDGSNAWLIGAHGGTVEQAGWPALDLDSASLRWQSPTLFINSSTLRNGTGQLNVTGSVETRQEVNLDVKFDGIDINPLLTPDWRERLSGRLTGQANVQAPLGTATRAVTVSGSMALVDGELTALPILDQIGTFTGTERFRRLELTRASADFTRTPDRLEVRNLVVEAAGLIRVEGAYTVQNGDISGALQVGLTPATLQWIPGSQEQVFTVSRDGYFWTSMNLSGSAEHPTEDLTPRLVAATGKQVIQGVEGTVKKATQGVLDLLLH